MHTKFAIITKLWEDEWGEFSRCRVVFYPADYLNTSIVVGGMRASVWWCRSTKGKHDLHAISVHAYPWEVSSHMISLITSYWLTGRWIKMRDQRETAILINLLVTFTYSTTLCSITICRPIICSHIPLSIHRRSNHVYSNSISLQNTSLVSSQVAKKSLRKNQKVEWRKGKKSGLYHKKHFVLLCSHSNTS